MITAIQWIRKGVAAQFPSKYELNDEEYDRIKNLATEQLEDAKDALKEAEAMEVDDEKQTAEKPEDDLAEYNLDSYDDEIAANKKGTGIFSNMKDLAYHDNNEDDPYITIKGDAEGDEEREELEILPTDNLILTGRTEEGVSHVEVQVFEESEENIYVHHDIMLPSMPLCFEWLDFHSGSKVGQASSGNYIAIGTFEPDIEIWDLDMVDAMYPEAILGHADKTKKRKKKVNDEYHIDAIMCLSWNKLHRNVLLSSSADTTVKLWDLTSSKCQQSYTHHSDKVQSVSWHPTDATVFITGSYDKSVCVLDARAPERVTRWKVESDVESIAWDPHTPTNFYVAMENGMVQYYDARKATDKTDDKFNGRPLFNLQAHDGAVSALDVNPLVPGCIATGGTDKLIKVWNTADNKPSMVTSRNFELGRIFAAQFCPDSAFQLGIAGSSGKLHIWDMSTNAGVRQAFKSAQALQGLAPEKEKAPVTLPDDEEEDDEEDERLTNSAVVAAAAEEDDDDEEESDRDSDMDE